MKSCYTNRNVKSADISKFSIKVKINKTLNYLQSSKLKYVLF